MAPQTPPTPAAAISPGGLLDLEHAFRGESWDLWRTVLRGAWGEPLSADEVTLFREVAERDPPTSKVQELWCAVGRSGGKDSIASAIAVTAALQSFATRRPGERTLIACIAVDRSQAEIVFGYIVAFFQHIPALNALVAPPSTFGRRVIDEELSAQHGCRMYVVTATDQTLDLTNGARIQVSTNSFRSVRGRSLICAILDEVAFYRSEESANPDKELYDALEPALARVPGSILIGISGPYRKRGLLYDKFVASYAKPDPDCLFVKGTTRQFNSTFSQAIIDKRQRDDPEACSAEYFAEWRSDLTDLISRQVVEACVTAGCHERARAPGRHYSAFIDASGGSGSDSMALAIAHAEDAIPVLDCIRERRPPFSPDDAVAEFALVLKSYGITRATSDHWGGQWPVEAFAKHNIKVEPAADPKSTLYLEALPLLNAHRCSLLDHPRLIAQLCSLERRVGRSGRDTVDHPPNGHDDLANVCAGALLLVGSRQPMRISPEALANAGGGVLSRYGNPYGPRNSPTPWR